MPPAASDMGGEQLVGALGEARHPVQPRAGGQHPAPMLHRAVDDSRRENPMTGDTEPHFDPRTKAPSTSRNTMTIRTRAR